MGDTDNAHVFHTSNPATYRHPSLKPATEPRGWPLTPVAPGDFVWYVGTAAGDTAIGRMEETWHLLMVLPGSPVLNAYRALALCDRPPWHTADEWRHVVTWPDVELAGRMGAAAPAEDTAEAYWRARYHRLCVGCRCERLHLLRDLRALRERAGLPVLHGVTLP